MNNLTPKKRIFGLPPLLILIFFFMPWVTLSCGNDSISASGYQLAVEGSDVSTDIRIPVLVIGIASVVALAAVAMTDPLNRRYYTGTGIAAGVSYIYLLLRFNSLSQEARDQGGTLTLELAVWGVGLAIMAIIGLGTLYRPDQSSDSALSASDDPESANHRAQQAKMIQYATFAGLMLLGGVFILSIFQSIGADMERRQDISNATATQIAVTQEYLAFQATADANATTAAQTAVAIASATSQAAMINATSTAQMINEHISTAQAIEEGNSETILRAWEGVRSNAEWQALYPGGAVQEFEGIEYVLVPAGCFTMGTMENKILNYDTKEMEPQLHTQCVDEPFWIAKTELTVADFTRFGGTLEHNDINADSDRPVRVSWNAANNFCANLGGRLPTEREWEYAGSGPDSLIYPWGIFYDSNRMAVVSSYVNAPVSVGFRPAGISWVGVLDMIGNVNEWTSSLIQDYPYDPLDGRENLDGVGDRVYRGFSYLAVRGYSNSDQFNPSIGFRCARSVSYKPDFEPVYTEKQEPDLSGMQFIGEIEETGSYGASYRYDFRIVFTDVSLDNKLQGTIEQRCVECTGGNFETGDFYVAQFEGTIAGNVMILQETALEREVTSGGDWQLKNWLLYVAENEEGKTFNGLMFSSIFPPQPDPVYGDWSDNNVAITLTQADSQSLTSTPTMIPSGEEIFRDGFDDNRNNWPVSETPVFSNILGGKYLAYFATEDDLYDLAISYFMPDSMPSLNGPYEVELTFRVLQQAQGAHILIAFDTQLDYTEGYVFIFSLHDYQIGGWKGWSLEQDIPTSDYFSFINDDYLGYVNIPVYDGEPHVLKLQVLYDQAVLYIDNIRIGRYTSDSPATDYTDGGVAFGLVKDYDSSRNIQVEFDDFVIRSLEISAED